MAISEDAAAIAAATLTQAIITHAPSRATGIVDFVELFFEFHRAILGGPPAGEHDPAPID